MRILKYTIILFALMTTTVVSAQTQAITSIHGSVSDDLGPLMGATVCELDGNGRVIESTITDLNGNFTMKISNPRDKVRFSYVGMKTITQPINRTTYNIVMSSELQIDEVVVTAKKKVGGNKWN